MNKLKFFIIIGILFGIMVIQNTEMVYSQTIPANRVDPSSLSREQIDAINKQLVFRIEITHFNYASADILNHMAAPFENLARRLQVIINRAKTLGVYDKIKIIVVGYSDADGPFHKKLAGSKKRAEAVVDFLVSKGFERKIFHVNYRADLELKDPAKPRDGINRRVLVVFEGFPIRPSTRQTGDRTIDEIDELGFRDIRYFKRGDNRELFANRENTMDIGDSGVVKVTGRVISYLPGDKVFVRVRDVEVPLHVREDGTFTAEIVVYKGKNLVTFFQHRDERRIRRSEVLNIVSGIPALLYQFQLKWDGYGDLDLIVDIGDHTIFYFFKKLEEPGYHAELDVDNRFRYGPENVRVYKAPSGTKIKVFIDYFMNIPFQNKRWYHELQNLGDVNYTLFVLDGSGTVVKTFQGKFTRAEASILLDDRRLIAEFIVP